MFIDDKKKYEDSTITIFEVEERFPTGFFMQKAKIFKDIWKINGASKSKQLIFDYF